MKSKTPLKLAVVFVVLLLILIIVSRRGEEISTGGKELFEFSSSDVDVIELAGEETVRLEKQSGTWRITAPIQYDTDERSMSSVLSSIVDLTSDGVISSRVERQSEYGVDSTGTSVKVMGSNTELANFIVGSTSGDYSHSYLRFTDSNDILLVRGVLSRIYSKELNEWRDKRVLKAPKEEIIGVKIDGVKGKFSLSGSDAPWSITFGNVTELADSNKVDDIVSFLGPLKVSGFATEEDSLDLDPEKADVMCKVTYKSGEEHLLSFFGDIDEDSNFWLLRDTDPIIFKLTKSRVVKFYREADHFRIKKKVEEE